VIVFFDGVCGLCNGVVDLLLRIDRRRVLRYAPLQGSTARERVPREAAALDSLVVWADGAVFRQSGAVLAILARLGGPWRLLGAAGGLVPARVRDALYGLMARHRYRWFRRRDACRMPAPEERGQFLD
jgi:predicted DCC family thiol-disulfide oxidoreductase YuxK